jgi:nitrogen fixation/metabolism regulation signal transduction histidine kinase
MKFLVLLCAVVGAALLYLLSQATANTSLFAQHYPWLLGLGGALAFGLLLLISYQLWVLRKKLHARVFGSKLTLRLIVVFALMALVPGGLVYAVSVQFLAKSIESWFDVRVDRALEGGLNLGRSTLDSLLNDLNRKAELIAAELEESTALDESVLLNHLREQSGVEEATLLTTRGKVLAVSGSEQAGLLPELPNAAVMRRLRMQQSFRGIETIARKGLYLRVVVPVNVLTLHEDVRALQLLQPVPKELAQDAERVESVYRSYQELSLSRLGLKRIYSLTLTLTLLVTLLSAIAAAFLFSESLSAPLGMLAESARAIGKGDFSKLNPVKSRDELGVLTQSFNTMTRRLAEASDTMERNQQQLKDAKSYLESVLSNLTAGVLAFDERFLLRTVNLSASEILGVEFPKLRGVRLADWGKFSAELKPFANEVLSQFGAAGGKTWEKQIEYGGSRGRRTLLTRGTRLPAGAESDYVVVFDDITHLIQAQRDAAWGEVARRLAHEIKNPLTPIQLSAERLRLKLMDKLSSPDAAMLARSTETIVNQVQALKSMVDDFSEYARASRMSPVSLDLNTLIREVMLLYESMGARIRLELADHLPPIVGDLTLLRQVLHNLVQNALDALTGVESPLILVRTDLTQAGVRLAISDNGSGFSENLLSRIFEPYVTTKTKGTGLGLAIVKKIVDEHHGRIQVANVEPHGANVSIVLPLAEAA